MSQNRSLARALGYVCIVAIVIACIEGLSWVAVNHVIAPRNASLVYGPKTLDRNGFDQYMRVRHPILGWPAIAEGESAMKVRSRPIPSYPEPGGECVSLYGDSFTYGDEVRDDEAWSDVLSELLECRVANFAMGGYGMDQALMRYQINETDRAPTAILGIYPYDLLRNVNQYRPFLAGFVGSGFGLKPRFILEQGELRVIPIPTFSYEELTKALNRPERFFPHESFLPNSPDGPARVGIPYTMTALRIAFGRPIRSWLVGRPSWESILDASHPSRALEIASAIAQAFVELAESRGAEGAIVIFPTVSSLRLFRESGYAATSPVTKELERAGIRTLDLHEPIATRLGTTGDYCEFLTDRDACSGHYNALGNRMIAELVKSQLLGRGD